MISTLFLRTESFTSLHDDVDCNGSHPGVDIEATILNPTTTPNQALQRTGLRPVAELGVVRRFCALAVTVDSMNRAQTEKENGSTGDALILTLGLRRSVSCLGLVGVLYFAYRLTGVLCICPGYGIAMGVCSAIAVAFGPTVLRIVGSILLALSIFTTIDMFQAKAAQDAAINKQLQESLKQYQQK